MNMILSSDDLIPKALRLYRDILSKSMSIDIDSLTEFNNFKDVVLSSFSLGDENVFLSFIVSYLKTQHASIDIDHKCEILQTAFEDFRLFHLNGEDQSFGFDDIFFDLSYGERSYLQLSQQLSPTLVWNMLAKDDEDLLKDKNGVVRSILSVNKDPELSEESKKSHHYSLIWRLDLAEKNIDALLSLAKKIDAVDFMDQVGYGGTKNEKVWAALSYLSYHQESIETHMEQSPKEKARDFVQLFCLHWYDHIVSIEKSLGLVANAENKSDLISCENFKIKSSELSKDQHKMYHDVSVSISKKISHDDVDDSYEIDPEDSRSNHESPRLVARFRK